MMYIKIQKVITNGNGFTCNKERNVLPRKDNSPKKKLNFNAVMRAKEIKNNLNFLLINFTIVQGRMNTCRNKYNNNVSLIKSNMKDSYSILRKYFILFLKSLHSGS